MITLVMIPAMLGTKLFGATKSSLYDLYLAHKQHRDYVVPILYPHNWSQDEAVGGIDSRIWNISDEIVWVKR